MTAGPWRPVSLEICKAYIEHSKLEYQLSDALKKAFGTMHVQTQEKCDEVIASLRMGDVEVTKMSSVVDKNGNAALPFVVDE